MQGVINALAFAGGASFGAAELTRRMEIPSARPAIGVSREVFRRKNR